MHQKKEKRPLVSRLFLDARAFDVLRVEPFAVHPVHDVGLESIGGSWVASTTGEAFRMVCDPLKANAFQSEIPIRPWFRVGNVGRIGHSTGCSLSLGLQISAWRIVYRYPWGIQSTESFVLGASLSLSCRVSFIVQSVKMQDIWLLREAIIPSVVVGFLLTLVASRPVAW